MKLLKSVLYFFLFLTFSFRAASQEPAALKKDSVLFAKEDSNKRVPVPKKATIRSAILPGWGQAYNKKYWKIPIVYTALGITGYIFVDNLKTYREYRFAYAARSRASKPGATAADSADYYTLKEIYKIIQPESIRSARDRFRQYIDYSVLFFILFWGLNVVDATVDAHLQSFDVSPSLSFKIKAGYSPMAQTNGLSLVLNIGKTNYKKKNRFSLSSLPNPAYYGR